MTIRPQGLEQRRSPDLHSAQAAPLVGCNYRHEPHPQQWSTDVPLHGSCSGRAAAKVAHKVRRGAEYNMPRIAVASTGR